MLLPLLAIGAVAGVALIVLLTWTRLDPALRFWPAPRRRSWQSVLFWTLFRTLNVAALAVAALGWERWDGLSPDRLLGAAVAVAGGALYGLACYALGRSNLYCGQDGLVTQGIYRWTRNPQYATAIPAFLGLALASRSCGALALAVVLAAVFVLMALAEEPWLEAAYGEEYLAYRRRVARFWNWSEAASFARTNLARLERALKEAWP
jgi:protein-S-isoprenylcysteine O-methyltransferase Ste14